MYFLTYNDAPDGIYMSQVIDVCRFWEDTFNEKVYLISIISLRNFSANKKKIKQAWNNSIVIPMFPGIGNWKKTSAILRILAPSKRDNVIARGVFATLMALECKSFEKVCFDARGAYAAEWEEYLKVFSPEITKNIRDYEKQALLNSYSQIAVSAKLVDYWRNTYGYTKSSYSVIPCTLNSSLNIRYDLPNANKIRQKLGISTDDTLLVYSGSSAEWQSFKVLEENINKAFAANEKLKILMLGKQGIEKSFSQKFPGKVFQKWVEPVDVQKYLQAADYGLLIREDSVTNAVSSPVKFAEYMAAGLPVIISEHIGDYSSFVTEKNCGMLAAETDWTSLQRISAEEKKRIQTIAEKHFRKSAYKEQYQNLF
ncbi:MAG TPA: glycosyltransferase [Bacteroidia bacterium]|nr:glycosyltransferase [Bacteroidia bacterium]